MSTWDHWNRMKHVVSPGYALRGKLSLIDCSTLECSSSQNFWYHSLRKVWFELVSQLNKNCIRYTVILIYSSHQYHTIMNHSWIMIFFSFFHHLGARWKFQSSAADRSALPHLLISKRAPLRKSSATPGWHVPMSLGPEKIPPENIEVIKASKESKESKSICPTHNSGNSFHQEDRKNSEHGNPSARGGDPKLKPWAWLQFCSDQSRSTILVAIKTIRFLLGFWCPFHGLRTLRGRHEQTLKSLNTILFKFARTRKEVSFSAWTVTNHPIVQPERSGAAKSRLKSSPTWKCMKMCVLAGNWVICPVFETVKMLHCYMFKSFRLFFQSDPTASRRKTWNEAPTKNITCPYPTMSYHLTWFLDLTSISIAKDAIAFNSISSCLSLFIR